MQSALDRCKRCYTRKGFEKTQEGLTRRFERLYRVFSISARIIQGPNNYEGGQRLDAGPKRCRASCFRGLQRTGLGILKGWEPGLEVPRVWRILLATLLITCFLCPPIFTGINSTNPKKKKQKPVKTYKDLNLLHTPSSNIPC